jgi:drug/metabolite transporter (DMT)-like permease
MAGLFFSLSALMGWGFGDFFIQRTIRRTAVLPALSYIGLFAGVGLLPFVWGDIPAFLSDNSNLVLLGILSLITLATSLIQFEAFKEAKLAVLEPILSMELPATVLLSVFVLGDALSPIQVLLIVAVFLGITLVTTTHRGHLSHRHILLEKGTLLGILSVTGLALGNVLVAKAAREISPLFTIWSSFLFIGVVSLITLILRGELSDWVEGIKRHPKLVLGESLCDTFGWLSFAFATTFISVPVATTISESYVLLTIGLGVLFNKEKIERHQSIGIPIAVGCVLLLASISS